MISLILEKIPPIYIQSVESILNLCYLDKLYTRILFNLYSILHILW